MITLNAQNTASFDIDCQYTFTPVCPNELPVPGGTEIVAELNAQAQHARYRVGSKEAHSPQAVWVADEKHPPLEPIEGDNVDVRWVAHAIPGTKGFELLDGLPAIGEYDFFVWKGVELDMHPYGSCYHDLAEQLSTGVIEFLRIHEVSHVIVGGLATDFCVYNTVMQLVRADFQVILNLAASRGLYADKVAQAVQNMREAGVIVVSSSQDLSS